MLKNIKIGSADEITDQHNLTQQLINIDYKCFGDLEIKDEGKIEDWKKINEFCFTIIIFDQNIPIGYIDFLSINSDGVTKLLDGKLRDGELFNFINADLNSPLTLYIVAIAILKDYRNKGLSNLLWNKSRDYFISNGYLINKVYANIWTESGWNFFSKFNTELKKIDDVGHRIVEIPTIHNQLPISNI